jgi:hypothetical protein
MTEKALSLPEFTALLILAIEAREVSNLELKERFGSSQTITGGRRTKLNDLKLVDTYKQGRTFVHVLTDKGWARLAEDLRAGNLPPFAGSSGVLASLLFAWLPKFLHRTELSLAEAFQPEASAFATEPTDEQALDENDAARDGDSGLPTDAQANGVHLNGSHPHHTQSRDSREDVPRSQEPQQSEAQMEDPQGQGDDRPADLESRIRSAYTKLAAAPGAWVSLTRLRPLLDDVPRQYVDEALILIERSPDVTLVPESNQKTLTQQDREAAVIIGGQNKHLLWIGAAS